MRIGFDARMIEYAGIGRYIKNLLTAMLNNPGGLEFTLYGDPIKLKDFINAQTKEYKNKVYGPKELLFSPFNKDNLDIIHIPHFNVPLRKNNKLVITLHDFIYLKFKESRTFLKGLAAKYEIANAVKQADAIIAISENTKKDITEYFPRAEKKIKVIYEASDPVFKKIDNEIEKELIRKKYSLPELIILSVGTLKKHKNIERLIDAYTYLKAKKNIAHKLVIIGRCNPNETKIINKIKENDVLYLGEIPNNELVLIYNLADITVIPSLYEGFGLPVLEAMACGSPVIASDTSSLSEIIENKKALFNPMDISNMADKIYEVLTNKDLQSELIRKGFNRVSDFSWEKTAEETLKVYNQVCNE